MRKRIITALLTACLLVASMGFGEGLLPTLTETYGVPMPSLIEVMDRYPDSEETGEDGTSVQTWTGVTEDDFTAFGVLLRREGVILGNYSVNGNVFDCTLRKDSRSFAFTFDTEHSTARVAYPTGTYDRRLYDVKAIWNAAEEAERAGDWSKAAEQFASLKNYMGCPVPYLDCDQQVLRCWYAHAEALEANGQQEQASALFLSLGEYRDSYDRAYRPYYDEGIRLRSTKDWDAAVAAFEHASEYSDAREQIRETRYQQACSLLITGEYYRAFVMYRDIRGYKDVDELLENDPYLLAARTAMTVPFRTVGNYVTFGTYEQDGMASTGKVTAQ